MPWVVSRHAIAWLERKCEGKTPPMASVNTQRHSANKIRHRATSALHVWQPPSGFRGHCRCISEILDCCDSQMKLLLKFEKSARVLPPAATIVSSNCSHKLEHTYVVSVPPPQGTLNSDQRCWYGCIHWLGLGLRLAESLQLGAQRPVRHSVCRLLRVWKDHNKCRTLNNLI